MRLAAAAALLAAAASCAAAQERGGGVTQLRCEPGANDITAPAKLAAKAFERLPLGQLAPAGWLLDQLVLQANSLAGYMSDSTFPGADHVNTSLWSGGNGSKMGGTTQWLPYWTNGQVPNVALVAAAGATGRITSGLVPVLEKIMTYVLENVNTTNGWIGPYVNEPGDSNGHGLWDPLNMVRSLLMYAEARPEKEAAVAKAIVAHLLAESKLLQTDPVIKWAQTRWPTFVELCQYVVDTYVPKYGGNSGVMPLGGEETTQVLLNASALFASRGMDWLSYYHRNGTVKFPLLDVHAWNTNDHGVNNAEGALRWPAVTYRMTGAQQDADQMAFALQQIDTYQGQVAAMLCADEVFCGRAPHRGTETCAVVEAMTALAYDFEVLGTPGLMDRVERLAFNAMPAALTADMWTHVYVQNANSVFAGQTKAAPPTPPLPGEVSTPMRGHHLHHSHQTNKPCAKCTAKEEREHKHEHKHDDEEDEEEEGHTHLHGTQGAAVGLKDKPSGEDQGANFYGVSHFPCCITNFPQGWPKFAMHAFVLKRGAPGQLVVASLVPASATLPAWLGGAGKATVVTDSKYPFGDDATITVTAASSFTVAVRVPGWATAATVDGKAAPNGTLVEVPHQGGVAPTVIKVALNPAIRLEYGWGPGPVAGGGAVEYSAEGAAVPSDPTNQSLFDLDGGAAIMGSRQPGYFDIRTGSQGTNSSVTLTTQLRGGGHAIDKLALSFRYVAGYSPDPEHPPKVARKASVLSVVLADAQTGAELATVYTSPPLGDYSFDHYTGYSPPMKAEWSATAVQQALKAVPNGKPVSVVVKFANNQRNLQVQLSPKTGLNCSVGWATASTPGPPPPPAGMPLHPATNGLAVVRGPLVFTLHPAENMTVVKNYSAGPHADLPGRPMAVDWEIDGTDSPWNYAVDTSAPPSFNPAPSAGWSSALPFSTNDYPFSIEVAAKRLPLTGASDASWGYWQNSKITANLPPSPLKPQRLAAACAAAKGELGEEAAGVAGCGEDVKLKLVPYGGTNIRIAVFPWFK